MIYTHIAAWLLGAAIAATTAWQVQDWRLGGQITSLQAAHATALATAQAKALAKERDLTTRYQGALNEARTLQAVAQRDAARARTESDSLREQASDAARRIATAAPGAVAEYAHTVTQLFGECSRSYQELAAAADGHSADARTLRDAWPMTPPED